ncbi:enoyl-CoA hydratase/carnithine racemase [Nocardia sp. GAS34]|uniref:enoyl-CoA hydratase/isomerase family protein n=1 Tax=unclassified Nocardia TaxID=2637762 RepID=UPI003D215E4B
MVLRVGDVWSVTVTGPGNPADMNRPPLGVRSDLLGGVTRICLDRPPVNAFTVEMFGQLAAAVRCSRADPRPVLLTGANGRFSAGFDINEPDPAGSAPHEASLECLAAIREHPAPVVAAVEGAAVGIGLLIAMSADILVVSRSARLRMPEARLGIDIDVAPLRRFLPAPWIRRLCLLGEVLTAADLCLDHGTGAIVCEPGEAERHARAVLDSLAGVDEAFLRRAKRQLIEQLST